MPPDDTDWVPVQVADTTAPYPWSARLGDQGIFLFQTSDGLRGVERHCPHEGALLAKATLLGSGRMLKCPLHNFVFRLSDGIAVNCPGYRLRVFEVRDHGGTLFARPVFSGCRANDTSPGS